MVRNMSRDLRLQDHYTGAGTTLRQVVVFPGLGLQKTSSSVGAHTRVRFWVSYYLTNCVCIVLGEYKWA